MSDLSRLKKNVQTLKKVGAVQKSTLVGIFILLVITALLESFGMAMILPLIEFIQNDGATENLSERSRMWQGLVKGFEFLGIPVNLISLSTIIFLIVCLRQCFQYVTTMRMSTLRLRVERGLRQNLFSSLLRAKAPQIQRVVQGNFIELVSLQAGQAAVLVESVGKLCGNVVVLFVYAILTLIAAFGPSLLAIFCIIGGLIALNGLVRITRENSQILVAAQKDFTGWISERVFGWRLVKLANAIDREIHVSAHHVKNIADARLKIDRIGAVTQAVMILGMCSMILLILNISFTFLSIQISVVTLFAIVLMRLMPVAMGFTRIRQNIEFRAASLDRIQTLQNQLVNAREFEVQGSDVVSLHQGISFENVSFSYESSKGPALHDISLTIPTGKMTAIVGASGAGKSTLGDMILRLIEPTKGDIYFDAKPISEHSILSIRRAVAYLPQQPIIFNESAWENLAYMNPGASREQIQEICKASQAHDFIMNLPEGYDTLLGEGGNRLSGGQRQRIALARAMLSDSRVLLLDEPTSALDMTSENLVKTALQTAVQKYGMTVIVIAHSLSLVSEADQIIQLDNGRIVKSTKI